MCVCTHTYAHNINYCWLQEKSLSWHWRLWAFIAWWELMLSMGSKEDNGGCASCQFLEHILSGQERVAQHPICHFCPWKQELINDNNFHSTKAHAYLCPIAQFQVVLCYARLLSCVQCFATPLTVAHQDLLGIPGSMGILQARILEWVAVPSSRESSQPRDWTQVSCIVGRFFTFWATREA